MGSKHLSLDVVRIVLLFGLPGADSARDFYRSQKERRTPALAIEDFSTASWRPRGSAVFTGI
jgi:hypothetical protein